MTDTTPSLTTQQIAALETADVSIALSAGAGCGKTFVLTQRFLRYLETRPNEDPLNSVVAITFTDRAAREMRDRIRSACQARLESAASSDAEYWLSVMRNLDSARITTIHSFCATILRAHAVEAGIDPRFRLMEESLGDSFLKRTVIDSLHELLSEHNDDAMELVFQYGLERTRDMLVRLVKGRFQGDTQFSQEKTADELVAEWREIWNSEYIPRLLKQLSESKISQNLLSLLRVHVPNHEEMKRRCDLLLQQLPVLETLDNPAHALSELRAAAQVQGGGGKRVWENEAIYSDVRDAFTAFRKSVDRVISHFEIDDSHIKDAATLSVSAQKVVARILDDYERGKQQQGILDFDDLLLKTRDLLRGSFHVRQQLSQGIDFLMVDEFQDTDPVQSEIVHHLCGERLLKGKLFLVGDAKQSIYRFRRADPRVFSALRTQIPEAGRLPLSVNFRSQPAILHFVNLLFAAAMGEDYEPLIPHVSQMSPQPCIEFLFPRAESEEESDSDSSLERRRREADWIARRIVSILEEQQPMVRDVDPESQKVILRPATPGDITILFRTLSNVAIYEDALRQYGIDYYLVGGRTFFAQQEISDLVNLLVSLNEPDDAIALAGVLRSPFFNLSDETLLAMTLACGSLREALSEETIDSGPLPLDDEQLDRLRFAAHVLNELKQLKDRLSLAELLRLAIEKTGYDAALLNEFLGRRKLANLDKLVEMARQFDASGLTTLGEFIQKIRESVVEESEEELAATHPETSNVVRLMTVHQSKGLEFPIVIVADMDWMRHGGAQQALVHPQLGTLLPMPTRRGETPKNLALVMHGIEEREAEEQETIRVLYVATTRAADRLILSAGLKPDGRPASPWMKLLAERFDLQTGLVKTDPYLGSTSVGAVAPDEIPEIRVHHQKPKIPRTGDSSRKTLPLEKFRDAVLSSEPAPLPPLLQPLLQAKDSHLQVSVTDLCRIDSGLQNERHPDLTSESGLEEPANAAQPFDHESTHPEDARTLGTLIHKAIETIPLEKNINAEAFVVHQLPSSSESLKEHAIGRLRAFVQSEAFTEMCEATQCYREIDFLLNRPLAGAENRQVIISGQLDCLIQLKSGQWKIVDFKTGRISQNRLENLRAEYGMQLAVYALAVREMLGRMPDSVEIVVLHDQVHRVPIPLDEVVLQMYERRIDASLARFSAE
ncbi:MAG: hypothetical protein Tsb009_26810 [Planctomycetaceae bacterium]